MSGRPYTYGRAMAIAQLMRDMRRPALKKVVEEEQARYEYLVKVRDESGLNYPVCGPWPPVTVYLYGEDLFIAMSDTIDWVPKLCKLNPDGSFYTGGTPVEGWPTEEEIAAEIAASAEREKNWNGSLSANDITAIERSNG